jgi:hypothetical protein
MQVLSCLEVAGYKDKLSNKIRRLGTTVMLSPKLYGIFNNG